MIFWDTYALIELLRKNAAYARFSDATVFTTRLNLLELHQATLRVHGQDEADAVFDRFRRQCIGISDDALKRASVLRRAHRKRRLSYIDCVGYVVARMRGMVFLTGDQGFHGLPGVELVK